jgi:hypothetical protein
MRIPDRVITAARPLMLSGLDELLLARGFRRDRVNAQVADRRYYDWRLDRGVIEHEVTALYRPRLRTEFDIAVSVALRLRPDRRIPLDGTTVHYLNKTDRVLDDTVRALAWFGQYATPAQCLARLASPDRNGTGVGTKPHAEATRLLESLVP